MEDVVDCEFETVAVEVVEKGVVSIGKVSENVIVSHTKKIN